MKRHIFILLVLLFSMQILSARRITQANITLVNSENFTAQIIGKQDDTIFILLGNSRFTLQRSNIRSITRGLRSPVMEMVFNDVDWLHPAHERHFENTPNYMNRPQRPQETEPDIEYEIEEEHTHRPEIPADINLSSIVKAMNDAANSIMSRLDKDTRIALINITSDEDAEFVTYELEDIMVKNGFTGIVDRNTLDVIRTEQALQLSGEVNEDTAIRIGKFVGANVVISCLITGSGETRRLRLRAINVETAGVIATASEAF
jgi:hypothetical protein